MNLPRELVGCRVKWIKTGKIYGKIIWAYTRGSGNYPYFLVLTNEGIFREADCVNVQVVEEDLKKIYNYIKPDPVDDRFEILDLTSVYDTFLDIMDFETRKDKIAIANLKPRLRMMALYFIGQSSGNCLVVGTSNRAELAIGYFTKYGDGAADFEPIASLYKHTTYHYLQQDGQ